MLEYRLKPVIFFSGPTTTQNSLKNFTKEYHYQERRRFKEKVK